MAIVKNTNSNYYVINTPRGQNSNITFNTDAVVIPGNLTVLGATTSITTENTAIKDKIIVLNDGEADWGVGGNASPGTSGITVDRGLAADVSLRWNESSDLWELTTDGSNYSTILTGTGPGVGLTAVVEDLNPVLGGNLNTDGKTLYANTNVILTGNLQLNNTVIAPGAVTNSTVVYAQTPDAGQAGVYVVNQSSVNEELVTKRRAFGFSLIL